MPFQPRSRMDPLGTLLVPGLLLNLGFSPQPHSLPAEECVLHGYGITRASYPANGPWDITQEDVTLAVFLHNALWLSSTLTLRWSKLKLPRNQHGRAL